MGGSVTGAAGVPGTGGANPMASDMADLEHAAVSPATAGTGAGVGLDVTGGVEGGAGRMASGGDFSVQGDVMAQPGDLAGEVERAQGTFAVGSAEAAVSSELGAQGTSVLDGGTGGLEHELGGASARASVEHAAHVEELGARGAVQGAHEQMIEGSGYVDPESEIGRAEQLGFHQRDQLHASASTVHEAEVAIGDPEAALTARAEGAAMGEAMRASPVDAADVSATANVATATIRNPEVAAENRIDLEIDAQRRDAAATLGFEGSASAGTDRDDGGDAT